MPDYALTTALNDLIGYIDFPFYLFIYFSTSPSSDKETEAEVVWEGHRSLAEGDKVRRRQAWDRNTGCLQTGEASSLTASPGGGGNCDLAGSSNGGGHGL